MIDCKPLWLSSSPVRGVGGVQPSVFRGGQRSVGVLGLSISGVVWQAAAQTGGAGRHPTIDFVFFSFFWGGVINRCEACFNFRAPEVGPFMPRRRPGFLEGQPYSFARGNRFRPGASVRVLLTVQGLGFRAQGRSGYCSARRCGWAGDGAPRFPRRQQAARVVKNQLRTGSQEPTPHPSTPAGGSGPLHFRRMAHIRGRSSSLMKVPGRGPRR